MNYLLLLLPASLLPQFGYTAIISQKPRASVKILHQQTSPSSNPTSLNLSQQPPRCGEILHNVNGGGVYYKPFENVLNNERCAWVITPPGAVAFDVEIIFLGNKTNQENNGTELILTGIQYDSNQILTSYKPTSVGYVGIPNAHMLLVTFASTSSGETGFVLQYQAILEGDIRPVSNTSRSYLLEPTIFEFKYPQVGTKYNSSELSAFVLVPDENVFTGSHNFIYYKKLQLQSGCSDSVYFYKFEKNAPAGTEKWVLDNRMCYDNSTYLLSHDDMTLVVFRSASTGAPANSGFWLTFVGCSSGLE